MNPNHYRPSRLPIPRDSDGHKYIAAESSLSSVIPVSWKQSIPKSIIELFDRIQSNTNQTVKSAVHRIHTNLLESSTIYGAFCNRIRALPITEFYLYMWRVDPGLFVNTMFVNYLLPILMEAMPWYLSRRKISRVLRESRNSITHRLVANEPFSDTAIGQFVLFSLVYALVQTIEQVLRTRVLLANRLLIKRLVLERILYSELGSLQERYQAVFGEEVRTDQLEMHVFNDISETLNLFNTTMPSLMRGAYTLVGSAHDLWLNREAFDALAILRPSLVGLTSEAVNYVREKWIVDAQTLAIQRNASAMSRVVTNIVDGLAEIQINNMQSFQLVKLDQVSGEELHNQQGGSTFINNIYRQVSQRSVFDFASEVYVVRLVMQRRKINHETYRKIQNDIDYVTRLFGRLWSQARDAHRVYETQERVIALLNLPSFIEEAKLRDRVHANELQFLLDKPKDGGQIEEGKGSSASPPSNEILALPRPSSSSPIVATTFEFQSLLFRRCVFRYKPDLPLALNIHKRAPGEVAPSVEDLIGMEETKQETHTQPVVEEPRSTDPQDLLREIGFVLSHPRIPANMLRASDVPHVMYAYTDVSVPPVPVPSPHGVSSSVMSDLVSTSTVMTDLVSSADCEEDEDTGDVTAEDRPDGTIKVETKENKDDDAVLKELDEFVHQAQLDGKPLEFAEAPAASEASSVISGTDGALVAPKPIPLSVISNGPSSIPASLPSPTPFPGRSTSSSSGVSSVVPGTLLFERGRSYALIGENRSGKSTLMQILCKLYQPADEDCDIVLNGQTDFTQLPRMLLRDRVSYVAQRPFIFPGTIEENIRIGNTTATAKEVEQAAEWAGIFSMERPKPLSCVASLAGAKSLVDRTGSMALVAKPWEQNRLKNVLVAAGGWMQRIWMKLHGFDADASPPPPEEEDDTAEETQDELSHVDEQPLAAASSTSKDTVAQHSLHPTLMLETAERGANLSGGFAQSVALARVFLRKEAQIIILDEAMGQMDAIKKRELIFPRLFEFVHHHRMTLIIISHDVPLVCKLVDTCYVMHHGECVQSGSHKQLMMERGGAYARLVGAQDEENERDTSISTTALPSPSDII